MADAAEADVRINGGFFVLEQGIFDYMEPGEELVDRAVRAADRSAAGSYAYRHDGFWAAMDTFKDRQTLEDLSTGATAPGRCGTTAPLMLSLLDGLGRAPRLLFLGAHSDDIEIGCGGAVLGWPRDYPDRGVDWVVFAAARRAGGRGRGLRRARSAAALDARVEVLDFPENVLPAALAPRAEGPASRRSSAAAGPTWCSPTGAATPTRTTARQRADVNTFRDQLVLEYEIPKFDGDLGRPSVFARFGPRWRTARSTCCTEHFASAARPSLVRPELFRSLHAAAGGGVRGRVGATPRRSTPASCGCADRFVSRAGRRR